MTGDRRLPGASTGSLRVPGGRWPRSIAVALMVGWLVLAGPLTEALAYGPPFPDPVPNQAVYDEAGAFRQGTLSQVESTIDAIEQRTGAEIVVYSQLVPASVDTAEAERQAQALMDQWGVGRRGIDDGLVILFDLYEGNTCHGEVQLYAGPGYRATYLSNSERQAIYENDMLPLLRGCDLDGALLVAMDRIDAAATPEHAATLEAARLVNAVLGLMVAPLLAVLIIGYAVVAWRRYGKDPVYLDDPSIHIPAPPAQLTPAAGAVVRDGRASRRALTTASLDLAARGEITFESDQTGLLGRTTELSVRIGEAQPDDPVEQAQLDRRRGRPMDEATRYLLDRLTALGGAERVIDHQDLLKLGSDVGGFDERIERHVTDRGWFTERPGRVTGRWGLRGTVVAVLGMLALFGGFMLPADGLVVVGASLIASGVFVLILSRSMPARTMPGAMIQAMLEAYRRTLVKTMAMARSMGEVVETAAIPLIEQPDDAVVWGVALGLQEEVEEVLQRTAKDLESGAARGGYLPLWYSSAGSGGWGGGGPGGSWGVAPGLASSSPIPNFGGMMAALGTIGNSPSSSGSGGGFGGGGSGGGGGGAGGGF
jgi:uncharacterized membrane protein YgcG